VKYRIGVAAMELELPPLADFGDCSLD